MSRLSFKLALLGMIATLLGVGCSHEQKVAQTTLPKPPERVADVHRPPVAAPAPQAAPQLAAKEPEDKAIFFDFDSFLLRSDARPLLQQLATELRGKDKEGLEVDGNCDELGTVEYNLALGEQRARAAKEYLVHLGVAPNRIKTVSYGSQRPKFAGHDDDTRAKNRRDDFVMR